ncbi:hypothetical protein DACRYDRAFT_113872 [Dacryopinax primogenitus]|uniref:SLC41A/MgtE integral membrane domain-containing protein n=1 Tax=Dacryopinax primogenitus (strain DJM 731) TaxID=1858805 RepID=M5GGP3_DACPD|nr:uncharacterized protein DACRYDRAFT_113872 [Dacryopinax primogenitus]EJU05838.1 hypothetical protein DACRYDRAFT_113872 [Dacryopinax primogenitus]
MSASDVELYAMNGLHSRSNEHVPLSNEEFIELKRQRSGHSHEDGVKGDEEEEEDIFVTADADVSQPFLSNGRSSYPAHQLRTSARPEPALHLIRSILLETLPTLLFTIIGMVFSGELLVRISTWPAFARVPELLILVPVLDNLKGNVEMNLSSRLGTAANTGMLDKRADRRGIILGSLSILQVQALAVSAVAAGVSFGLAMMLLERELEGARPKSGFMEFMMVTSASMSAASLSGAILGSFMCSLILVCRYFRLNPDNISAPIAACLGDLLTMALLGLTSSLLISWIRTVLPIILTIVLLLLLITTVILTIQNPHVRPLLLQGWSPLFAAMIISTGAGLVLEGFVDRYDGFGMLAIVIGGLPGGIGSIFICRLSTALHAEHDYASGSSEKVTVPPTPERPVLVSAILMAVSLPVAVAYLLFVWLAGWMELPILFVVLFAIFLCIVSAISLGLGYLLTHLFWRFGLDPDIYCLPIQSSLVDLIGQSLLVACYEIARLAGASVGMNAVTSGT